MRNESLATICRQPFALVGALGFVSLLKSLLTLQSDIEFVVEAYQRTTRPVWEFLLGWIFESFNLRFPGLLKDYLTMGAVTFAAGLRMIASDKRPRKKEDDPLYISLLLLFVLDFLVWPIMYYLQITEMRKHGMKKYWSDPLNRIFFEFFAWTALIISLNYMLFVLGRA